VSSESELRSDKKVINESNSTKAGIKERNSKNRRKTVKTGIKSENSNERNEKVTGKNRD
jgi:hypothetical protein